MMSLTSTAPHSEPRLGETDRTQLKDAILNRRSKLISPQIVAGATQAIEASVLVAVALLIAYFYVPVSHIEASGIYVLASIAAGAGTVAMLSALGLYKVSALTNAIHHLPRVVSVWAVAMALVVVGIFLTKAGLDTSRVWIMSWFLSGAAALFATRLTLSMFAGRWAKEGRFNRRAVIFGNSADSEDLIRALSASSDTDVRICGIFDDRDDERTGSGVEGYPILGRLEDLVQFVRKTRVDLVIISIPLAAEDRLAAMLSQLSQLPVDIRLAGNASKIRLNPRAYTYLGGAALIDLVDKPISDWGYVAKSIFDKLVAAVALILLAPVLAGVALAVRLDSRGPILFRQKRYGFNNELIEVYKFRSMYVDMSDAQAAKLVTKDDPRVTPVGRFIRKSSLDELPQLLNVLFGDLSLVGPRPHAVQAKAADKLYDVAVDNYFARHKVKPGITGWAQINGWRGETDTEEKIQKRVEHDLYYIDNWSLIFDVYILVMTPLALIKTENAY